MFIFFLAAAPAGVVAAQFFFGHGDSSYFLFFQYTADRRRNQGLFLFLCEGSPSALPSVEGAAPLRPRATFSWMRGALPLCTPQYAGAPPCTRVTFSPMRKSPKNLQGLCPLESPGAWSPPFSRSLHFVPTRAGLPSIIEQDRFATLSLWENRSCFFLWFR